MVYRKGELTTKQIDREWPYQVALAGDFVAGKNHKIVQAFCAAEKLSVCRRTQGFYREARWHICYCFADREHAERFQQRFGGEFVDPKERPRWPGASKRSQ